MYSLALFVSSLYFLFVESLIVLLACWEVPGFLHGFLQGWVPAWLSAGLRELWAGASLLEGGAGSLHCCLCMAPYSSTLAWKIPWMEEPGGLQSMGSRRVGHD